jgi:hypothetical protein
LSSYWWNAVLCVMQTVPGVRYPAHSLTTVRTLLPVCLWFSDSRLLGDPAQSCCQPTSISLSPH